MINFDIFTGDIKTQSKLAAHSRLSVQVIDNRGL